MLGPSNLAGKPFGNQNLNLNLNQNGVCGSHYKHTASYAPCFLEGKCASGNSDSDPCIAVHEQVRWAELREFTLRKQQPWPLSPTIQEEFEKFAATVTRLGPGAPGFGHDKSFFGPQKRMSHASEVHESCTPF